MFQKKRNRSLFELISAVECRSIDTRQPRRNFTRSYLSKHTCEDMSLSEYSNRGYEWPLRQIISLIDCLTDLLLDKPLLGGITYLISSAGLINDQIHIHKIFLLD